MALYSDTQPYVLAHRRDDAEECRRLDTQHEVIKHGILDGQLIHPSIPRIGEIKAIADLGCGTGAWLEDVANTNFAGGCAMKSSPVALVGFDINALAFNHTSAADVQLVEHDCTQPFDPSYTGKFDLVNIRGLAFALPKAGFPSLIKNAVHILKPGGYLQWLETDAKLWKAYPDDDEVSKVLDAIDLERRERDLLLDLPRFMLQQLLSFTPDAELASHPAGEAMTITSFNLCPGGISSESRSQNSALNQRFSDTVLESMKLVLDSIIIRKLSKTPEELRASERGSEGSMNHDEARKLQNMINFVEDTRKSGTIMMGGHFPQIIAQRSVGP
ncbi:MAG: hypothetical protein Q9186_006197 [Xanthomendoza sp. 1 TL-2023]